jgi:histidine ammonia-lyase/phenylalanine ammonia-lyase
VSLGTSPLTVATALDFIYQRSGVNDVQLTPSARKKVTVSQAQLLNQLEKNIPIYGVTTGFGNNCQNAVDASQSEVLQHNLISYLLCGTGPRLPRVAVRGMVLARLTSLSRGLSGVSVELLDQMSLLLNHDLLPLVPCEGSLGASGDLIPLAYLGQVIQGDGDVETADGVMSTSKAFAKRQIKPYKLQAKEGLAIANGTSAMAGMALVNYNNLNFLADLAALMTSWTCMVLRGKAAAFGSLVNGVAKGHEGQRVAAGRILGFLKEENYPAKPQDLPVVSGKKISHAIQDRYSLRCGPQILGPVLGTLAMVKDWIEQEINSVSDNPLVDPETGEMVMGGNFYGGYLAHGMDYFKICVGHLADMLDRQLMLLFDTQTSSDLPTNLVNANGLPENEKHLHHGLKGLHQATSAITSEILQMAMPSSLFSRSSESHNQDKVSLGMSSAVTCQAMLDKLFTTTALHLVCLHQALSLRGVDLQGATSRRIFQLVQSDVGFIRRDQALGAKIATLTQTLKDLAATRGQC